jgi:RNA polymerase sigma-70 factor (ECF subfamily)
VVPLSDREISAEIIDSCRRGDRDAFRALYDMYKDRVYSIALHYFRGDASAAGDATQQVFLKLITNLAQFRGDSRFSTWLYRFVVNACIDSTRSMAARAVTADRTVLEALASPAAQHDAAASAEMEQSIQAAVASLPPKLRLAVLLRYFDELSYDEMAEAMGCSAGTVASRLSRAHALLARKLAPLRAALIGAKP